MTTELNTPGFKLFQPAKSSTSRMKVGFYGFAGSGKTYTATMLAVMLAKRIQTKKPIAFFDTETGSDYMIEKFKKQNLELVVLKRRSLKDLIAATKEAEQNCDIMIVDSVSHCWNELIQTYTKEKGKKKLSFPDWGILKPAWQVFTDLFLNSQLHMFVCGRAGNTYDMIDHGLDVPKDERWEVIKTGTKMKAETEMGYEPSLLIEMERVKPENGKKKGWIHRATILKDRTQAIDGKQFDDPTFKDFEPVFNFLNLSETHVGVDTVSNSSELFDKESHQMNWELERKQVAMVLEEIDNELAVAFPGSTGNDRAMKILIKEEAFKTKSWEEVMNMPLGMLHTGLKKVKEILTDREKITELKTKIGTMKD